MPGTIKQFNSIKSSSEAEIKEKGSVFRGMSYPVEAETEVLAILSQLRKKYYDATHYCFAYRLRNGNFRYSDDGEPSGTAGKRIFNVIEHYNLYDTLLVVLRWFGGTKLGTGPLGKAYYEAADDVIKASEIVTRAPFEYFRIKAPYEYTSQLYHILEKYKVKIEERSYDDVPEYTCLFPLEVSSETSAELTASSDNKIEITNLNKIVYL